MRRATGLRSAAPVRRGESTGAAAPVAPVALAAALATALAAAGCGDPPGPPPGGERPNVLLIVADDLGYTDLGAYEM